MGRKIIKPYLFLGVNYTVKGRGPRFIIKSLSLPRQSLMHSQPMRFKFSIRQNLIYSIISPVGIQKKSSEFSLVFSNTIHQCVPLA